MIQTVFFNNKTMGLDRKRDETNEGIDFFFSIYFSIARFEGDGRDNLNNFSIDLFYMLI